MSARTAVSKIQGQVRATRPLDNPFVQGLVRFGYVARGLIYALIGLLSVQLAFAGSGKITNENGAIAMLGAQPFGRIILILLTVGLLGYAFWGFVRAAFDPLGRGHDAKGLAERGSYLVSGITYGSLAAIAYHFATGTAQKGVATPQDMSAQLLLKPYGVWLVALLGVFWISAGVGQLYIAYKGAFLKDLKSNLSASERKWAGRLGRAGYAARGIIFTLVGWFVIQSAMQANPQKAVGLDGALLKLAQQPYGEYLLGVVALGLLAFGIYSILCARWMDIKASHM